MAVKIKPASGSIFDKDFNYNMVGDADMPWYDKPIAAPSNRVGSLGDRIKSAEDERRKKIRPSATSRSSVLSDNARKKRRFGE